MTSAASVSGDLLLLSLVTVAVSLSRGMLSLVSLVMTAVSITDGLPLVSISGGLLLVSLTSAASSLARRLVTASYLTYSSPQTACQLFSKSLHSSTLSPFQHQVSKSFQIYWQCSSPGAEKPANLPPFDLSRHSQPGSSGLVYHFYQTESLAPYIAPYLVILPLLLIPASSAA